MTLSAPLDSAQMAEFLNKISKNENVRADKLESSICEKLGISAKIENETAEKVDFVIEKPVKLQIVNKKEYHVKFSTSKDLFQIKGCTDEIDSVSILSFICENEFQSRPDFKYEEVLLNRRFKATLEINLEFLCCAEGQNKKEAKFLCAKMAIFLIAPNAF